MKNRTAIRSIIIFLSVVFLFFAFPSSVFANDSAASLEMPTTKQQQSAIVQEALPETALTATPFSTALTQKPGDKTIDELQSMTFDAASMPEFVNIEVATEKEHVNRLTAQENSLGTVMYQNRDGSKSVYIFSNPVKYIDTNGNIKDKSSKITAVSNAIYSYAMTDNSTKVFFPKNIVDGTHLSFSDRYSIKMTPKNSESSTSELGSDGKITYNGAFGRNTLIVYETKLNGLKEDIVLIKNVGVNKFEFELETSLTPKKIDGVWYLEDQYGKNIASFGDIIIKDSEGKQTVGEMTVSPSSSSDKYNVMISAPTEFLNAATTAYPVYIDPTIWEEGYYYEELVGDLPYNAIMDTGLYETEEALGIALNTPEYHFFSENQQEGRIIYKLYDFFGEHGIYKDLTPYQIGSARLYFNVLAGSSMTLTAKPMTDTWNSLVEGNEPVALCSPTLWNSTYNYYQSSVTIDSSAGEKSILITNIVKQWARYNNYLTTDAYADPSNGFVLTSNVTTETYGRYVNSVDHSSGLDNVYVVLDIGDYGGNYYISNFETGKYLGLRVEWNEMADLLPLELLCGTSNDAYGDDFYRWRFEYKGANRYYICLENETNYGLGRDYSDNLVPCALGASDYEQYWQFQVGSSGIVIKSVVTSGADKFIAASSEEFYLASSAASNSQMNILEYDSYTLLTSATISYPSDWMAVNSTLSPTITVTPSNATIRGAGFFTWTSSDESVATIDRYGQITAIKNGFVEISAVYRPNPDISFDCYMIIGQLIPNGTYQIVNISSGKYMNSQNPHSTNGIYVNQMDKNTQMPENFTIIYDTSGYYYIKSEYDRYIAVDQSSLESGAAIIQTTTSSNAAKWKIKVTDSGYYKFIVKLSENVEMVLAVPNSGISFDGTNLIQQIYTEDTEHNDKWSVILPTNGSELGYGNSVWSNQNVIQNTVCYGYAINNIIETQAEANQTQQPGAYSDFEVHAGTANRRITTTLAATIADFNKKSVEAGKVYTFEEVDRFAVCPDGTYKVVFVVGQYGPSYYDYHWYRQNSDGTWSHKQGATPVKNVDNSGNTIYDPFFCDRGIYTYFVGYYAVTPWE